jgi:DNA-binding MarR family transcriptional regulator
LNLKLYYLEPQEVLGAVKAARQGKQSEERDSVDSEADAWVVELPGVDPEVETTRMRLLRIGRQMERMLAGIAERHGMSLGDWETLSVLRRSGRPYTMSPTNLARSLEVTSGTISVRLDRLVRAGLVRQVGGNSDARSRPVRLTNAGSRRWREATTERTALELRLLSNALSKEELQFLNRQLRRLMLSLESNLGPASRRLVTAD